VADSKKLERDQLGELLPTLLQAATDDLAGPAANALLALAETSPDVATAMFNALDALPDRKIKPNFVLKLRLKFKDDERLGPLVSRWEAKGTPAVRRQAERSRSRRSE